MKKSKKKPLIIISFLLIFAVLFVGLNTFVQPIWTDWSNYDSLEGFYEQPDNTVETLFIGGSTTVNGIIPIELYENYGICAYNYATQAQPTMMSYYMLKDAYRLHSESMKTVFLDVSMLRTTVRTSLYRKPFDSMQFSSVKLEAAMALGDKYGDTLSFLVPILSYHDRWSSIEKTDFTKYSMEPRTYLRGYNFSMERCFEELDYEEQDTPPTVLDETAETAEFCDEALTYLEKIDAFCDENSLKLVLIKTPTSSIRWNSSEHNETEALAEKYDIDFLDYEFGELAESLDYNYALENLDSKHLNYYGATKLTDAVGKYISECCDSTDVRGDEKYEFLETELADYNASIKSTVSLLETKDVADYLTQAMSDKDNTVFISVDGSAAEKMTDAQRETFASLGLDKLSELEKGAAYIAVYDQGTLKCEETSLGDTTLEVADTGEAEEDEDDADGIESEEEDLTIQYKGLLSNHNGYSVVSGGYYTGNTCSIVIDSNEEACKEKGLNIVVFDNETETILDSACFDLINDAERESFNLEKELADANESGVAFEDMSQSLQKLVKYNARVAYIKEADELKLKNEDMTLDEYIAHYSANEDLLILIAKGGSSYYVSCRDSKGIVYEDSDENEPIIYNSGWYVLKSQNVGSIVINGKEYAEGSKGINVVVYDKKLGVVADSMSFTEE